MLQYETGDQWVSGMGLHAVVGRYVGSRCVGGFPNNRPTDIPTTVHHRSTQLPHTNPDPNAVNTTRSPSDSRPDLAHSSSAIGIVAAVVFP